MKIQSEMSLRYTLEATLKLFTPLQTVLINSWQHTIEMGIHRHLQIIHQATKCSTDEPCNFLFLSPVWASWPTRSWYTHQTRKTGSINILDTHCSHMILIFLRLCNLLKLEGVILINLLLESLPHCSSVNKREKSSNTKFRCSFNILIISGVRIPSLFRKADICCSLSKVQAILSHSLTGSTKSETLNDLARLLHSTG